MLHGYITQVGWMLRSCANVHHMKFCKICCIKKIVRIEGDTLLVRYFNFVLFNKHYNTAI
jgi:hypothetical protein